MCPLPPWQQLWLAAREGGEGMQKLLIKTHIIRPQKFSGIDDK